jgi:hypothetical protein
MVVFRPTDYFSRIPIDMVYFFSPFFEWCKLSLCTAAPNVLPVPAVGYRSVNMENWWNDNWQEKSKVLGEKFIPLFHFFTANITQTALESNPSLSTVMI